MTDSLNLKIDYFSFLPPELIVEIIKCTNPKTFLVMRAVSKITRDIISAHFIHKFKRYQDNFNKKLMHNIKQCKELNDIILDAALKALDPFIKFHIHKQFFDDKCNIFRELQHAHTIQYIPNFIDSYHKNEDVAFQLIEFFIRELYIKHFEKSITILIEHSFKDILNKINDKLLNCSGSKTKIQKVFYNKMFIARIKFNRCIYDFLKKNWNYSNDNVMLKIMLINNINNNTLYEYIEKLFAGTDTTIFVNLAYKFVMQRHPEFDINHLYNNNKTLLEMIISKTEKRYNKQRKIDETSEIKWPKIKWPKKFFDCINEIIIHPKFDPGLGDQLHKTKMTFFRINITFRIHHEPEIFNKLEKKGRYYEFNSDSSVKTKFFQIFYKLINF